MNGETGAAQDRLTRVRIWLAVAVGLAATLAAACSLSWRMFHDVPMLLYQSNLAVSHGMMPYRDFFYLNLPGTFWFFNGVIRLLGTSDWAIQSANLVIVALVSGLLFWALPKKGVVWCVAFGVGLGVLRFFSGECVFVLQRETIAMVPMAALLTIGIRGAGPSRNESLGSVAVGLLVAWMALIKPQLALYGVPVVVARVAAGGRGRHRLVALLLMGAGFTIPIAGCAAWLVRNGAWSGFCETLNYWPLYGQMNFSHGFVDTWTRYKGIFGGACRLVFSPYMAVAVGGLFAGWRTGTLSRLAVWLWGGMLAMSVFVPSLSGQFWGYHRFPFYFMTLCVAGYILTWGRLGLATGALLGMFWMSFAGMRVWRETTESSLTRLQHGIADQFAGYMKKNLRHGERVQPIDWVDGAVHGMLMVDALQATRFTETYYFLHHVNNPVVQKLRREFMDALTKDPPQIFLEARDVRWPNGKGTEARIEAFERWRAAHYRIAEETEHYRIWERIGDGKGV